MFIAPALLQRYSRAPRNLALVRKRLQKRPGDSPSRGSHIGVILLAGFTGDPSCHIEQADINKRRNSNKSRGLKGKSKVEGCDGIWAGKDAPR